MYEPQRQENHNICNICKQCSTVNSIYSQSLNTIIYKQCGMFYSLSGQCRFYYGRVQMATIP